MKNIIEKEVFEKTIKKIESLGYEDQAIALSQANIIEKPWYMPWKHLSTTLNGTIYLSKEWTKWDLASHLAHEATHLLQQNKMGMPAFLTSYTQKPGRLRLELEAHGVEFKIHSAGLSAFATAALANILVFQISQNYAFGVWYDEEKKTYTRKYLMGVL